MNEKLMAALLDLRIALGELEVSLKNIDKSIQKLMAVELEIKKEKPKSEK